MISIDEVKHVAKLARLSLTDEECRKHSEELSRIIEFFDELKGIDTEGVEPMSHPISAANALRPDQVVRAFSREELMACAPVKDGNFFKVPKIGE